MTPSCDNCGLCCMGQNLLPRSGNLIDKRELPPELQQELDRIGNGPLSGDDSCPCVWLDRATGRCKHYEHRPSICREFEIGDGLCLELREKAGLDCWE